MTERGYGQRPALGPLFEQDVCSRNHGGNENSVAAHASLQSAGEVRRRILELIRKERGGLTCDEIEQILGLSHQSASARCAELKRDKQVIESGKRKTRTGRLAGILVAI